MAIAPIALELDRLYAETPRDDTEFYHTLTRLATGICLAQTGSKDEDLIQEMVINVWQKLLSYANKSRFSTWAANVMRNTLRDAYRRRGLELAPLEAAENEQDDASAIQARLELQELVERLDEADQELVRLHLEGYTLEEIGIKEGITPPAALKRWRRVMQKLQEAAEKT